MLREEITKEDLQMTILMDGHKEPKQKQRGSKSALKRFVMWWEYKKARRAAKKYKLDFKVGCVFDHQLRSYGYPKNGDVCRVQMESGKIAMYKAHVLKWWPGGTGQKDWGFEFLGYDT